MGKTLSLRLLVHPGLCETPELKELAAKGHTVHLMPPEFEDYDLILGSNCYRIVLLKYLKLAIKTARKAKKESGKNELVGAPPSVR